MKVLFVAHSGELSGGANRTLLTLMAGLREQYGIAPSILIPGENTLEMAPSIKNLRIS